MFFAKRRYALRVIEKMGLDVRSPEATELVDMIITGAKQYAEMFARNSAKISELEQVLWSVAAMTDNASAYSRLARTLSNDRVNALMQRARQAGRKLAIESGFPEVARRGYDALRPVGQFTTEQDDRNWAINDFREKRREIESLDHTRQMAFAIALGVHWKSFLAQHESPTAFGKLPREQQMDYFKKCLHFAQLLAAQMDKETALAQYMLNHYLGAIINNDREFETEAGQFLDAQTRKGWPIAGSL